MTKHHYYVYIMTNYHETTFYIGVTNSIYRRIEEHKQHLNKGFTDKYNLEKLVYCEYFTNISDAISREKQLKAWRRQWKIDLIRSNNPDFKDISNDFKQMDW